MTDELLRGTADAAVAWLPFLAVTASGLGLILLARWLLGLQAKRSGSYVGPLGQLTVAALIAAFVVAIILSLPIGDGARGQLLSLLGLLLTAAIALASTTFLGNAMAGLMLRTIGNFKPGDFVRVGDQFGRVSEQGLLHTEIQTEDSDLTTLPNLQLVTSPITVIRSSGTIITVSLSLGYDVPADKIEQCLITAAEDCGLESPFVQVTDLGDMAVTYKIAGTLKDVSKLISMRSKLRRSVMDHLHHSDIEIVSPNFMIQRPAKDGWRAMPDEMPAPQAAGQSKSDPEPEKQIFDKADEAEAAAKLAEELADIDRQIADLATQAKTASKEDRQSIDLAMKTAEAKQRHLEDALNKAEDRVRSAG